MQNSNPGADVTYNLFALPKESVLILIYCNYYALNYIFTSTPCAVKPGTE